MAAAGESPPGGGGYFKPEFLRARDLRNLQVATQAVQEIFASKETVSTPSYTPPLCRTTVPGHGGAPVCARQRPQRPQSAPSTGRRPAAFQQPKTERWREAGQVRWPPVSHSESPKQEPDAVPFRRSVENAQDFWGGTLWERSLRTPGVELEDPIFSGMGGSIKDLREEWQECAAEYRWSRPVPYSGSTASGKVAKPQERNAKRWVERPVAAGKYALEHMDGIRYKWHAQPRPCLTFPKQEGKARRRPQSARR